MAIFDAGNLSTSNHRLWSLIAERAETGADTDAIDERIWDLFGERWAIMFTDLSGFSRKSEEFGITHFLQDAALLLYPLIEKKGGVLVKEEADSLMVLFRRPQVAVEAAIEMQQACDIANKRLVDEDKVLLCIGIGYGDILRIGDEDVWGAEVNYASKLGEDTAKSYEILITPAVAEILGDAYPLEALAEEVAGTTNNYRLDYGHGST